jgi:UDP:flavonoid glycosyltransferase YjiC (YdhE family)
LHLTGEERLVLVSLGGVAGRLPVDVWPRIPGVRWLVSANWSIRHPDAILLDSLEMDFRDVLASCDALVCKPGYGSFVEAACNGVPVLFVSRDDWPETAYLKRWIQANAHGVEISRSQLESGKFSEELQSLWSRPAFTPVKPGGVDQAADWLAGRLLGGS